MAARTRQPIGSAAWIAEERASALQIAQSEVEEFTFSARNDVDWLNEHMAEIFSENQINVAEVFKTPGKLRGRTPKTARKKNPGDVRVPLSNIFSATPKGAPNPFAIPNLTAQTHTPKLKIAEDKASQPVPPNKTPARAAPPRHMPTAKVVIPASDSGYHGSQSQDTMEIDELAMDITGAHGAGPKRTAAVKVTQTLHLQASPDMVEQPSPTQPTVEPSFHSAKEEQTVTAKVSSPVLPTPIAPPRQLPQQPSSPAAVRSPHITRKPVPSPSPSPVKSSPIKTSPVKTSPEKPTRAAAAQQVAPPTTANDAEEEPQPDEIRSPSDGSSPIRPVVRKSSMNFASLPAREPLASHKSLGGRLSRTSHLDQTRMSYYSRHTGGKSLGNTRRESMDDDHDEMDIDDEPTIQNTAEVQRNLAAHSKTYTQRLQDQISMLGKSQSQAPRPSKSLAHQQPQQAQHSAPTLEPQPSPPPKKQQKQHQQQQQQQQQQHLEKKHSVPAPGAFPDDEGDDWIEPPAAFAITSPRPVMPKSHSADVMEQIVGKETVGGSEFILPKQRQHEVAPSSPRSPKRAAPAIPERTTSVHSHHKSASVPFLPQVDSDTVSLKKTISVSNPALSVVSEDHTGGSGTPSKSPSRTFRDSPLKQVKNKLSSILKTSKGLLASSAAISAEGKSSLLSPSTSRLALLSGPSVESLAQRSIYGAAAEPLYPDLTAHTTMADPQSPSRPESPSRSPSRRTRASTEREKREQKSKEKEAKETQRLADQISKLEKAREKEREKARVFSEEQEKLALERQLAAQKERELASQPQSPVREPARATRSSPRKAKAQLEAEGRAAAALPESDDLEMTDAAPSNMPPPSLPRSAAPPSAQGSRSVKRPLKPTKEAAAKAKQAPTVIRVNTTSSQHSQFHPSNSVLAATLQDTLAPQPPHQQLKSKASSASLQAKPSLQSLKSSVSASGRPKALELAAKRKEQEEREAQRKREVRAEMEKKRLAAQEEERKLEERRKVEAQKQKDKEREDAEARKRQAAIERAKQTRAPPPPHRSQPNGPPEYNSNNNNNNQPRNDAGPSRPPSRLGSMMPPRSQEELGRPVNAVLSNAAKAGPKRPLPGGGDGAPDESSQSGPARNGPSYQSKEAKRMRMSDEFDELDTGSQPSQSNIKGPPVRPSGGFKKDAPTKSLFPSGYAAAPPPSATRDLFKATVTAQHNNQAKANHPLDMAQVSKGAIPFAANAAGPSTHKTPARPAGAPLGGAGKSAAKSAAKSSPRFANGDAIELPDIQTDDEDSDDDGQMAVAPWADSPVLRRALMQQETIDPMQVFGPPAALNMEEVFSKTKERWHSFRKRTSSANWSGADRLTEEDIRKDLMAREKMRREGGWSYELSKEMI